MKYYEIKFYDYKIGELLETEQDNKIVAFAELISTCLSDYEEQELIRLLQMSEKKYWDYVSTCNEMAVR
jgi:succinate dehydrogenase flavin-adding protein (antitoxin of CptAB toxin-antitoxin module)